MEKMQDLKDLLKHEIQDLYSAETQLIEALPKMAEKATNTELKKALQQHLRVTEVQKNRLDQIMKFFGKDAGENEQGNTGLFSRLFSSSKGVQKCIGMEAIIKEGEKIMGEEMNTEVMDAAIIGAAQKAEHYEICGYGTSKAYARELELGKIAELLEQTLDEEYEADDRLTDLAVGGLNEKADEAGEKGRGLRRRGPDNSRTGTLQRTPATQSRTARSNSSSGRGTASKSSGSKTASKKPVSKSSSSRGSSTSKAVSKADSKTSRGRSTKTAPKRTKSSSKSSSR